MGWVVRLGWAGWDGWVEIGLARSGWFGLG